MQKIAGGAQYYSKKLTAQLGLEPRSPTPYPSARHAGHIVLRLRWMECSTFTPRAAQNIHCCMELLPIHHILVLYLFNGCTHMPALYHFSSALRLYQSYTIILWLYPDATITPMLYHSCYTPVLMLCHYSPVIPLCHRYTLLYHLFTLSFIYSASYSILTSECD